MSSSSSNKSDARRRTDQDHETDQITYGHFNPGVGHDIPGAGGRRRTENVPPGLQATLETSREEYQQFVERETSRDPAPLSTTPRFPESTAAIAAAARTNFTFGAQRGASQGHLRSNQGQSGGAVESKDFDEDMSQRRVRSQRETCGNVSHAVR